MAFAVSPPISSEKIRYREDIEPTPEHIFPKSLFLLESSNFYKLQLIMSFVFLESTSTFHSFLRKCFPNTCMNNHSLSIIFSNKNSVP